MKTNLQNGKPQFTSIIRINGSGSTCLALLAALCSTVIGCKSVGPHPTPVAAIQTNSLASAKGRTYRVLVTTEQDRFFETESEKEPAMAMPRRSPGGVTAADDFAGTDRKAAKTSISTGPVRTFNSLDELLASLPQDTKMLHHNPAITKSSDSQRVTEEDTNVVVSAFLFAAKGEPDNDFHMIIGSTADAGSAQFMNVEISGLPTAGPARARLSTPRQDFKNFFGNQVPGSGGYHRFDPPIPLRVSGSQFYDIDHKPGAVGPRDIAPHTAWEIHPVTEIVFEPQ